jgi:hypothetical protein
MPEAFGLPLNESAFVICVYLEGEVDRIGGA